MTRIELVLKKLAEIETFVAQIRTLGRPQEIGKDLVQERFIEHTLQIAIQAMLDVASHIVSDDRLGEPRNSREMVELLARHGWITDALCTTLRQVIGFRNLVVHGYGEVDPEIVRNAAEHGVADLLDFVAQIRSRLGDG